MAHITRRTTADGKPRWDVRWTALGRWQTKTFMRRQDADAFRRKVEADELRGMAVDVRRSSQQFGEFARPSGCRRGDAPTAAPSAPGRRRTTATC